MVGRFVEQQQVRGAHQCLRQVQAHTPATGETADLTLHLLVGEAQPGQQLASACVGGVTVGAVELRMQTCLSGAVLRGFGLGQRALYFSQALVAIEHVIHGQAFECVDLLAHVRDTPVGGQQAVAGIRRQLSRNRANRLDLPAPLAPIRPALWPACRVSSASSSRRCGPRCKVRL